MVRPRKLENSKFEETVTESLEHTDSTSINELIKIKTEALIETSNAKCLKLEKENKIRSQKH